MSHSLKGVFTERSQEVILNVYESRKNKSITFITLRL